MQTKVRGWTQTSDATVHGQLPQTQQDEELTQHEVKIWFYVTLKHFKVVKNLSFCIFFLFFCVVGCGWTAWSPGSAGHVRSKRRWGNTWLQGLEGTNRITGKIWTPVRVQIIEVKGWREHWVVHFNPLIRCVYVFFPKGMPGLPGEKGESGHVGLMVSSCLV